MFKLIFILFLISGAFGAELATRGEVAFEFRAFQPDDDPKTKEIGLSLAARIEGTYTHGNFEEHFRLFTRSDEQDESRSVFIIEEAYASYLTEKWVVKAGHQILNWSATEAFHPADVVNTRNLDSNIESAEKFGEPMIHFNYLLDNGAFNLYLMPFFTDMKIPASTNRLSFKSTRALPIKKALWLERDGTLSDDNFGAQFGIKYDLTLGSADFAFYYLQMNDRTMTGSAVETTLSIPSGGRIIYIPVNQYGFTYQHAIDAFVLKLETAYKDFVNPDQNFTLEPTTVIDYIRPDHFQIAWGVEYGLAHKNGGDSTFILEGQHYEGTTDAERVSLGLFQRDVLIGYRFAFNDIDGRELFISLITDLERESEYLCSLQYSQRLSDTWSLKTGLRVVEAPIKDITATNLENLHESNHIFLNLTKFF
jgi:hypothetical protein